MSLIAISRSNEVGVTCVIPSELLFHYIKTQYRDSFKTSEEWIFFRAQSFEVSHITTGPMKESTRDPAVYEISRGEGNRSRPFFLSIYDIDGESDFGDMNDPRQKSLLEKWESFGLKKKTYQCFENLWAFKTIDQMAEFIIFDLSRVLPKKELDDDTNESEEDDEDENDDESDD
jgi:hypothetical protein